MVDQGGRERICVTLEQMFLEHLSNRHIPEKWGNSAQNPQTAPVKLVDSTHAWEGPDVWKRFVQKVPINETV